MVHPRFVGLAMSFDVPYIELQTTSNFSFLRGASHPEELVEEASRLGYPAIGLSDVNSLAGIVRAHKAAKENGIALVIGAQCILFKDAESFSPEADYSNCGDPSLLPFSLLLYPTDRASYGRLCKLLTCGKRRAAKGCCYLTLSDIAAYSEGLLAIVVVNNPAAPALTSSIAPLLDIFEPDRLSLRLSRSYGPRDRISNKEIIALHADLGIDLVVTNDVFYHLPERRRLQDVLTCIRRRCTIQQAGRSLFTNAERHLKPPEEMLRLFRAFPRAVKRTLVIAERALGFSLDMIAYEYPKEICPQGEKPIQYLTRLAHKGARERYPGGVPDEVASLIKKELALVQELDYAKYFLTVHDIVRFARSRGILCQGRGAAANSAVCYVLGITAVDPGCIRLMLERFISKERNEPPDIDIDFEHERREEVIQYIYNKYGRARAALTCEVISYRSKSAYRDVGKALGLSPETITTLIKLQRHSQTAGIAAEEITQAGLNASQHEIILTIQLAAAIKGFPRHLSQHVGGFIISDPPLCSVVPIENAAMPDRSVIEWDKDDIDYMGMLKIDVLGLGMLTCIRKALELVNSRNDHGPKYSHQNLLLHTIPPEEPEVYDLICRADTVGIFQIESRAQMNMLPRLKPRCFYDLVIEVAIVRPGPIQGGIIHPYLRRRNGKERITYPDERVKEILERTLGVPIFQEQIMEIAVVCGGFTPGEADNLRRALGSWKRNKDIIGRFGRKLRNGIINNGYPAPFADQCIRQIKGFAEYGFPQSHAASFALLVYVSAWLKQHHPAAFAAALLNSQPMGFYHTAQIVYDTERRKVAVHPIDIHHSQWDCTLEGSPPALRLGMRIVKGLPKHDAEKIIEAVRRRTRFPSITELWRASRASVHALKALARADCFRSLNLDRQAALWQIQKLRDAPLPLFDGYEEQEAYAPLPQISKALHVTIDYQSTGVSLKAHPMSFVRSSLSVHGVITAADLEKRSICPNRALVLIAGIVIVRQRPSSASGVLFITLEDETGFSNLIIKSEIYERSRLLLCNSAALLVRAEVQRDGDAVSLLLQDALDISQHLEGSTNRSRDFR